MTLWSVSMIAGASVGTNSSGKYFPTTDAAGRPKASAGPAELEIQHSVASSCIFSSGVEGRMRESVSKLSDSPNEAEASVETFGIHTQTNNVIEYGGK